MKTEQCPSCGTFTYVRLKSASVVVCKQCYSAVIGEHPVRKEAVPDDWSFIRIGTKGTFQEKKFEVIGRIRLTLLNDYKNFWTVLYENDIPGYLVDSFGSFAFVSDFWNDTSAKPKNLHAGSPINIKGNVKLKGEFVERCEIIHAEGEIADWKFFDKGFFFIQAGNDTDVAYYFVGREKEPKYLSGKRAALQDFMPEQIKTWDEWK